MLQHMVDVSTFTNAAYSFLNYSRKEVVMLTSVIAPPPPDYFIILTHSSPILAFLARVSQLLSAWFRRKPCTLAVCACRTQDNYKPHHIKYQQ